MNYSKPILNWFVEPLAPLGLWLKITLVVLVSIFIESQPTHPSWAISMILMAAFILVPIGFQQVMNRDRAFQAKFKGYTEGVLIFHGASIFLLAISFILEKNWVAGLLALPYTIWCAFIFLKILQFNFKLPYLTTLATWGFLTNAAVWCVFDRFNYQPLGFTSWIVLLTGAHFHYAGFALTLSLSLLLNENPQNKNSHNSCLGRSFGRRFNCYRHYNNSIRVFSFYRNISRCLDGNGCFFSRIIVFTEGVLR